MALLMFDIVCFVNFFFFVKEIYPLIIKRCNILTSLKSTNRSVFSTFFIFFFLHTNAIEWFWFFCICASKFSTWSHTCFHHIFKLLSKIKFNILLLHIFIGKTTRCIRSILKSCGFKTLCQRTHITSLQQRRFLIHIHNQKSDNCRIS